MEFHYLGESSLPFIKARLSLYNYLDRTCEIKKVGKFMGAFFISPLFFIEVGERIANFAEALFKGIVNIAGAPFPTPFNAGRGAKQLFSSLQELVGLLTLPLTFSARSIHLLALLFINGKGFSENRIELHKGELENYKKIFKK
ncbi:hypothetical protein PHSC3_000151 [Chlamydiales bacterium STE3]|nr:hypothetical protein PHSC3_000151 [Chlamydiales bacterium STE3]